MHLLGNMWGQKWEISDIVLPYKDVQKIDTTAEMIQQNYTPKRMFEMAEEFFKSLNLSALPDSFWKKSIIEKPNDGREIICHASAWDFSMNDDVRIKMCTRVSMESFITIHHELGHVEYYLQYNKQPIPFRAGANPGFHEAIGDTIALSVATPKHLHRVGLLANDVEDDRGKINQLMTVGLQKLALLPFAYVMDKFRYEVFRGNIRPENANCHFWNLRVKYGGIGPASARSNRDFDITAKYHASADVEYMRYFVSNIIQFQFHRAACIKAGEYDADNSNDQKSLDNCDIYQSANAGNSIK
jgi:peptidyl-dipeptidase A